MMTIELRPQRAGPGPAPTPPSSTRPTPPGDRPDGRASATVTDKGGTMRLGAYYADARPRAPRWPRPTARRWCPSGTATATSSTPTTEASSRTAGFSCSGVSPDEPPGRVHRAAAATPSGSAPRPTPSSRARPNRPAPLFRRADRRRAGAGARAAPSPTAGARALGAASRSRPNRLAEGFTQARGAPRVHQGHFVSFAVGRPSAGTDGDDRSRAYHRALTRGGRRRAGGGSWTAGPGGAGAPSTAPLVRVQI